MHFIILIIIVILKIQEINFINNNKIINVNLRKTFTYDRREENICLTYADMGNSSKNAEKYSNFILEC